MYALLSIKQHRLAAGRTLKSYRADRPALALIMEGTGALHIGAHKYKLRPGAVIQAAPGTLLQFQSSLEAPLKVAYIHYLSIRYNKAASSPAVFMDHRLSPVPQEFFQLDSFHLDTVKSILDKLVAPAEPHDSRADLRLNMLFQELLLILSMTDPLSQKNESPIDRTMAWMEQNYMHPSPLGRLPDIAGLTPTSYCRAFRRVTGMSPGSYLTRLRINKAKALLHEPSRSLSLKEVARQVGYQDELYFSRTFKKSEGVSPSLYRRQHGTRVAIVSHLFLQDHMLALGVTPVAGPSFPSTYAGLGYPSYLSGALRDTVPLNAERTISSAELSSLSLDVIIKMDFNHNPHDTTWTDQNKLVYLNGITTWTGYLQAIAGILRLEHKAEDLIHNMAGLQKAGKDALASFTGRGKWVIIRVMRDDFRLYTGNNHALSDLLFHQLGFQPYEMPHEESYIRHALPLLAELDPERILVVWSDPDALMALRDHPIWRGLRAVASGQVYVPDSKEWDPWGPLGRQLTIQECVRYFGQF